MTDIKGGQIDSTLMAGHGVKITYPIMILRQEIRSLLIFFKLEKEADQKKKQP